MSHYSSLPEVYSSRLGCEIIRFLLSEFWLPGNAINASHCFREKRCWMKK
ncbi:MAG: hypothetical protein JW704_12520 [Anaerolineaceae bacterium]|nr:hypothetical protein [Anaerolineaceae bacterium]MBN2677766.1 hypothetical protein [Anaerolineaceae bacterium]